MIGRIREILGSDADGLLAHQCKTISKDKIHLPGPDYVDRIFVVPTGRRGRSKPAAIFGSAVWPNRLRVDFAGRSGHRTFRRRVFRSEPDLFDPENIVKLAIEGGCNAVASTLGVLGSLPRKYAHKIPFILKINHNEFLSYPNTYDQTCSRTSSRLTTWVRWRVGATIYFGSEESRRQIWEVSRDVPSRARTRHATVLWCYPRNNAFKTKEKDYHVSADLTGQANHLGVTIEADIIKQKLPENNGGYTALKFRQDRQESLHGTHDRSSDRLDAVIRS